MFVTTSAQPDPAELAEARATAARLGLPLIERGGSSIRRLLRRNADARGVLVVEAAGAALWLAGGATPLRFHGGLGVPRARHVRAGGGDALVEICGLRTGDRFVDATAGRCADALVAEAAVGPDGQVVALEANPIIHAVMASGLRAAGSRVELLCVDHLDWLRSQPSGSADVVYFDPMFPSPLGCEADFELMRSLAEHRRLEAEVLAEAARVARRRVVVLDGPEGSELRRLGLTEATNGRWARRRWGILEPVQRQAGR